MMKNVKENKNANTNACDEPRKHQIQIQTRRKGSGGGSIHQ